MTVIIPEYPDSIDGKKTHSKSATETSCNLHGGRALPSTTDRSAEEAALFGAAENPAPPDLQALIERADARRSDEEALFAAILAHDIIHPRASLPAVLHLDYDEEALARCFHLSHRLWAMPGRAAALRRTARSVFRQGRLGTEQTIVFKHIRARYKQLRFAYAILDDRHVYPRALDLVTKTMSHLQDALTLDNAWAARGHAVALHALLGWGFEKAVARELGGYRPTTVASFRAYIARDVALCLDPAEIHRMTGRQLHAIRKVISRQAALYDCLRVLYPSAYHDQLACYVSTINGLLGAMHDELVDRKRLDPQGYATRIVPVPERITTMLEAFAELHHAVAGFPSRARGLWRQPLATTGTNI